jgi:hypothetical protein
MKKNKDNIAVFILLLSFITAEIRGQISNCYNNYEKALIFYNSGMSDSTLVILLPCLENKETLQKVSEETRARIYRLAALSSIMVGDGSLAEEYIRQMIINQPDYKENPNADDLMEFKQILDKIEVKPSLIIGLMAGTNYPFVKLRKQYSNYNLANGQYSLKSGFGYQFEIFAGKAISKNISLEAATGIINTNFIYEVSGSDPSNTLAVLFTYEQKVTWLNIPVTAKYYFNLNTFKPYVEAGISGRIYLTQMEKSDEYGKYWFTNSSNSDKILTTFNTDFNFFGVLLGGGASYDINRFSLRLDLRYNHYFNNSGISANFDELSGYEDITQSENFRYTDDLNLISLRAIQISFGLLYNLKYRVF